MQGYTLTPSLPKRTFHVSASLFSVEIEDLILGREDISFFEPEERTSTRIFCKTPLDVTGVLSGARHHLNLYTLFARQNEES